MDTTEFNVPSISCSVCADKIKNGLSKLNGIEKVTVDLKSQMVNVDYNSSEIEPQKIRKEITALGYEVIQ